MKKVQSVSNLWISVDGEALYFNFNYKGLTRYDLAWLDDVKNIDIWEPEDKAAHIDFAGTQEEYDECVQPLVDLWQAEKDRIVEEEAQAQAEYEKYENRKIRAFDYVDQNYNTCLNTAPVVSALGYENAINTSNLSVIMSSKFTLDSGTLDNMTILDYHNLPREIDKIQAGLIISEIAQAQSHIKDQRKQFYDLINNTTDNATLNEALKKCVFTSLDFSATTMDAHEMRTIKELEINQIDILSEIDKRNVNK